MSDGFAGWVADVPPGGAVVAAETPGRDVASILSAPETYEQRQAERREQAERNERLARAQAAADQAESMSWLARLRGEQPPSAADVLGRARQDDDPGHGEHARRQAARKLLREAGLEDVLGGGSVTVLDANLGLLEPGGRGSVSRSAASELDDPQVRRSIEALRGAGAVIARAKARRQAEISRAAVHRAARADASVRPEADRWRDAERLMSQGWSREAAMAGYGLAAR